jgi:Kdo2-lipid IVA lauroyltransferase/acyltransferase
MTGSRLVRRIVPPFVLARDFLLAALVLPFLAPLWFLPWNLSVALARIYGALGFLFWGKARRTGMLNLRRAYGAEMTRARAAATVARVFDSLAEAMAEGLQFARRHTTSDSWRDLFDTEDPGLAARLLADPRPRVFVTGHLGSWEIAMGLLQRSTGRPGAAVVRRVDNPFLQRLVLKLRVTEPRQWIEKTGAVSEALARLRAGDDVALLADENGGPRGPFLPFFGRPASTRKTAALLAALSGAILVVGAVVRRPGPRPFLFRLAEIPAPGPSATPDEIHEAMRRLNAVWEAWVREDPTQWRWIHWRWRNRPDGTWETYRRRDVRAAFFVPREAAGEEATS